ncbi:MAG: hypothetical protein IJG37_09225, partial [Synergistaceae bacterium]|nr:hypothetical protein [Synergistaceae bacterium]
CGNNQLTSINLDNASVLDMFCENNLLTSLDIERIGSSGLACILNCSGNLLTELDVSKKTALIMLLCGSNKLTVLTLGNNANLTEVDCSDNSLSSLEISGCPNISTLKYDETLSITSGGKLGLAVNAENFPDSVFREYVSSNFDKYSNGYLTDEEIAAVTSINVGGKGVTSLKGMEYFTELTTLDCSNNQLTALDVSKNIALQKLNCKYDQLTTLDVSKNTALTELECNNNQLTALDVSHNTALTELSCESNQLTALDVSNNTALTKLYCDNNELAALDLTNNTALTVLFCRNNQLAELDLSNNNALTYIVCSNNQLAALDVSGFTALTDLTCSNNQLATLNVSGCTAIETLHCSDNQLAALDVSGFTALYGLYCSNNQLATLNVKGCAALKIMYCGDNKLATLDVSDCPKLDYFSHDYTLIVVTEPPEFKTQSLLLSGQIGLNFYMSLPAISGVDYSDSNCYMAFDVNGDSKSNVPQPYDPEFMNQKKTYYGFRCYINSIQMADPVTATFHYGGGMTVTKTYSAKSYIDTVLGMAGFSDEVRALMSAIKDYGHYMQVFLSQSRGWTIGVDHEEMPCASLYTDSDISEAASEAAKYKADYDVSGSGIKKLTYSLVLDSETALNIYLTPSESYTGNVAAYLDGGRANLAVKQSDGRYRVQISGISAHLLGNTYTLTVNAGSSFTVKISALSYVNAVLGSGAFGDDAKKGVTSLYRYYKATMSYRESEGIY